MPEKISGETIAWIFGLITLNLGGIITFWVTSFAKSIRQSVIVERTEADLNAAHKKIREIEKTLNEIMRSK